MSHLQHVKEEIAHAQELVSRFRAAVAAGDEVDYNEFNSVIEQACSAAIALPFDQVAQIRPDLTHLLEQLNLARDELGMAEATSGNEDQSD